MSELEAVIARYRRFAEEEAPGRSRLYESWAHAVQTTPELAAVLARIPATHRQPPLVFAVSRLLGAPETDGTEWGAWVLAHADALVAESAARSVQTNEPGRCAALLPALSRIQGPVALLEVGASAGLCLYPDRYSYRYVSESGRARRLDPIAGPAPVVLSCDWSGQEAELRIPTVVWRAGIDLHPLDVRSAEDRRWLTGLVWPGESGRRERIDAALDVAAEEPPILHAADAAAPGVIAELARAAPPDATLVVTTPGVLAHVPWDGRRRIIDAARASGRWITIDAPGLHDGWSGPIDSVDWPKDRFALALDGEVLAAVDPLGAAVEWRPDAAGPLG
ncbi:DUF2332 domain-containing protein [Microbacterium sp. SORGH_AS_0862]|uniref:DUF2332 domain-containing protein n=1 Tax=Microbacterium sp. SORGH_AS_0862 TaxID=3041789 RepID=UPI0027928D59|nr:DUF2332 domain-containing protein [Microbacterium sp. SORGH_AS_0862]MDQ1206144.1 hypothetical protein [Microbacterium sp. SORGH_AS_0862]